MVYCTLCSRLVEYRDLLSLRRHLLVRHQHDIVDDELVAIPARFLGLSLRDVGLAEDADRSASAVRLTASQHRRRQRERSEAHGNRRQGGGDRDTSTVYVRRVQAEVTASASAGSSWSPRASDPSPTPVRVDFGQFMPELSVDFVPPLNVSTSTMTDVNDHRIASSQTALMLLDFPSISERRALAGLVVEHPTVGVEAIVQMFGAGRRPFSEVELLLVRSAISCCMMSTACLAQRIRVEVAGHCARPETAAANLQGTWHQLGEYVDRDRL